MSNTESAPAQPNHPYDAPPEPQVPAYYQPAPRPVAAPFAELSFDDQRTAGAFVHLISFIGGFAGAWFTYLVLRGRGGLVRQHAAAAFNAQISYTLYALVAGLFVAIPVIGVLFGLAALGIVVLRVVYFVLPSQQAFRGELATIPLTIKFVS